MPYRPRSTVTRQLTDDEQALEQRAQPLLRNATTQPQEFTSSDDRYEWMKKDLEMRDMQTRQLQNESSLAGDLGDKRAYAAQNTKELDEDAATQRGLDLMAKKVASGIHPEQAQLETSNELGLGLNEGFHTRAAERRNLYETPDDRSRREAQERISTLDLGKKEFDHDVAFQAVSRDKDKADAIIAQRNRNQAANITGKTSKEAAEIEDLANGIRYDRAKQESDKWQKFGDGTPRSNAMLAASLADNDWGGISNKAQLVKDFSGPDNDFILQAMADKEYRDEYFSSDDPNVVKDHPRTRTQKIADFSKTINDYHAKEPDAEKDSIAHDEWAGKKARAEQLLYEFAGKHANQKEEITKAFNKRKLAADLNKAMEVANKETSAAFNDSSKEIHDSMSLKTSSGESAPASDKTHAMVSSGRAFLARRMAMGQGGYTPPFQTAKEALDKVLTDKRYLDNPGEADDEVHKIMARLILDQKAAEGGAPYVPPAGNTTAANTTAAAATPAATAAATPAAQVPAYTPEEKEVLRQEFQAELDRLGGNTQENRDAAREAMRQKGHKF